MSQQIPKALRVDGWACEGGPDGYKGGWGCRIKMLGEDTKRRTEISGLLNMSRFSGRLPSGGAAESHRGLLLLAQDFRGA